MRPRYLKHVVSEGYVQKTVVDFAKSLGWTCRKMRYEGRRGCPDFWFFGPKGKLIIVEFKRPDGPVRKQQARQIELLREQGFDAHIIDNVEDGKALFRPRWADLV